MDNREIFLCVLLLFCVAKDVCKGQSDPCIDHAVINDTTRYADYIQQNGDNECDRNIVEAWYKFDGSMNIPTSSPGTFRCGTIAPIWVNDSYPAVDGEIKTIKVCKTGLIDECPESWNIRVKKCGTFNAFYLTSFRICEGRYCVDGLRRCQDGFISDTGYMPCKAISLHISGTTNVAGFIPTYHHQSPDRKLYLKCGLEIHNFDGHSPLDLVWKVIWYIDDEKITEIQNLNFNEIEVDGTLSSSEWKNSGKKMGFEASCAVIATIDNDTSGFITSFSKTFIGITVSPSQLQMNKITGGTVDVFLYPTVPIACVDSPAITSQLPCVLRIEMFDFHEQFVNDQMFCNESILEYNKPALCGLELDGWLRTPQKLTITVPMGSQSNEDYTALLKLRSLGLTIDPLWEDYHLPPVTIYVTSDAVLTDDENTYCYSNSDPWFRTFDSSSFSYHGEGEFLLFRHTEKPIEVHTIQKKYNQDDYWTENCAVAVRAAGDVFMVYGCGKPTRWVVRRECNSEAAYLKVYKRWLSYEVHLPTGSIVRVQEFAGRRLDVTIYLSQRDKEKTKGICGNSNGDIGDDNIGRDGVSSSSMNAVTSSWAVQPEDSLFIGRSRNEILSMEFMYCACNSSTSGSLSPNAYCSWQDGIPTCPPINWDHEPCKIRTSRSTDDNDDLSIDVPESIVRYEEADSQSDEWKNGWDEASALESCLTDFRKSPAFEACLTKVDRNISTELQICINNIRVSGGTEFTEDILESILTICSVAIRVNTTLASSIDESGETLLEIMSKLMCPNDCTYNGIRKGDCVDGFCVCYPELTGDNCQVNMSIPPIIAGLTEDMICDTSKRSCVQIAVFGSGFYPSERIQCKRRQAKINDGQFEAIDEPVVTAAGYRNPGEVRCAVSPNRRRRSVDDPSSETVYLLSVSSNGIDFSEEVPVVMFDSTCSACTLEGRTVICKQKNVCVVDGKCYSKSSARCPSTKDEDKNYWMIAVVVGVIAVVVIIVVLVIKCHLHKSVAVLPSCMGKQQLKYERENTGIYSEYNNVSFGCGSPQPPASTGFQKNSVFTRRATDRN